ncbi:hypothetical protein [Leptolyngbya sp. Heron Island J]|uniref:hypothetical protein n=1 Tax=Leptolyngbya sp. Heron Island J TaxID=1385935 RepID=UPI0012693EDF|nr:hypothetical protein [Leptolyngbya sp. Heron Island J]
MQVLYQLSYSPLGLINNLLLRAYRQGIFLRRLRSLRQARVKHAAIADQSEFSAGSRNALSFYKHSDSVKRIYSLCLRLSPQPWQVLAPIGIANER